MALSLAMAACGQGNSGNVMAPAPNALSPEQVDAALGPELANLGNELDTATETNAAEPVETADVVEEATEPENRAEARPAPEPEPEPEEKSTNAVAPANNIMEE